MEIQWSLVLFTALSGAGAWLVACAGLDAFKGLAKKTVVPAVVTGIVLIIVGGIASATHLSHVDRIMAVLAHLFLRQFRSWQRKITAKSSAHRMIP